MPRKPKFRPEIRRVKLNPEQAVLSCLCYSEGAKDFSFLTSFFFFATVCVIGATKFTYTDFSYNQYDFGAPLS